MTLPIKVDRFKHDNLKISKEKLESLSLSGNDYVGHVKKPKQTKEKPSARDNLKLATGKLEDLTTSNTDFKVGSQCCTTASAHSVFVLERKNSLLKTCVNILFNILLLFSIPLLFQGHRSKSSSRMKPSWYQQPHSSVTHG